VRKNYKLSLDDPKYLRKYLYVGESIEDGIKRLQLRRLKNITRKKTCQKKKKRYNI
jgi:hypothetical protein